MKKIHTILHNMMTYLFILLAFVVASLCSYQNASAYSFPSGWVVNTTSAAPYFRIKVNNAYSAWATGTQLNPAGTGWRTIQGFDLRNSDQTALSIPGKSIYSIQVITRNCGTNGFRPEVSDDRSYMKLIGLESSSLNNYEIVRGDGVLTTFWFFSDTTEDFSPLNWYIPLNFSCNASANGDAWLQVVDFTTYKPQAGAGGQTIDYTSAIQDVVDAVNNLNTDFSSLETQITALNQKLQNQTEQERQQYEQPRSEAQGAQSDANIQGSASASDATTQGQTLLGALSSLISALRVSPSASCVLDLDLGNVDFGQVDLCSLTPPPAFQVISSLVVIGFAIPLSLAAAHKMINLFRSFTS